MHLEPGAVLLLGLAACALLAMLAAFALDLPRPKRRGMRGQGAAALDTATGPMGHSRDVGPPRADTDVALKQASMAWQMLRLRGGKEQASELLGALGDVLAVRAGVTPVRHTAAYAPVDGEPWCCRWTWACTDSSQGHRVISITGAIGIKGGQRMAALPFCEGAGPSRCPPWLEDALLARSYHQGFAIAYPAQTLRITATLDRPSAHVALSAHDRLQAMLPAGLSVEKAIADLTAQG